MSQRGSEQGDLEELARRYLDLWQDQMAALAGDPDLAQAVERTLAQWAVGQPGAAAPGAGQSPWGGTAPPAWSWPAAMMAALQAAMGPAAAAQGGMASGPYPGGFAGPMPAPYPGAMPGGPAAQHPGAVQGTGDGSTDTAAQGARPDAAPAGAAAAADAPGDGGVDLDQLLRRLAVLEERLAALENPEPSSRSGGKSGKAQTGGRKRRT